MSATTTRKPVPFRAIGGGVASAVLLVLSFPTYSLWWLSLIGLVPLLVTLLGASSWRTALWAGASCMIAFVLLGFPWVSYVAVAFGGLPWIVGKLVLAIFSLFGELQFVLFSLGAYAILRWPLGTLPAVARNLALLVALPTLYVAADFLYPKIFPNTLGHVFYEWFDAVQVAEFIGAFGFTFAVVLTNVALALLLLPGGPVRVAANRWLARVPAPLLSRLPSLGALCLVAAGLLAADSWGEKRLVELEQAEKGFSRSFKVSLIQANIGDLDKLASEGNFQPAVERVLGRYREMTLAAAKAFRPDLIVWPETAYPYLYTHFRDPFANLNGSARDQWVIDVVNESKTALFFGSYSSLGTKEFNTGFLLDKSGRLLGQYHKSILLAFGEYVPLGPITSLVQDIVPAIADFGRGPGPSVIEFGDIRLGPQICYEGIVPGYGRASVVKGAEVLFNITNDSWFGDTTEPWLHLMLTAFQSIELRRPLVRATNTGVSAVVGITGAIQVRSRLFEQEIVNATIRLAGDPSQYPSTFILRNGDVFPQACSAVAVTMGGVLLFAGLTRRRRRPA